MGGQNDLVIIAAHFKSAFHGIDEDAAMLDGVWQINDTPLNINDDSEFNKMRIENIDSGERLIEMNNMGHSISLNDVKELTENYKIKIADNATLIYYIFQDLRIPGDYEIRGTVANNSQVWTAHNFSGFYYDIDSDLWTERFSTVVTDKKLSGKEPYGALYETQARPNNFEFKNWGKYNVIGFLGKKYFSGYFRCNYTNNILFDESRDRNSLADDQILNILIDSKERQVLTSNNPLKLGEGYQISVVAVDQTGNQLFLRLTRNGTKVDEKVVYPSYDKNLLDKSTYLYKKNVGGQENLVLIAIHFNSAFLGSNEYVAEIEGVWQVSENPYYIKIGKRIDKMLIYDVDPDKMKIVMCNKDREISLTKDKTRRIVYTADHLPWINPTENDVSLMGDIFIKTANNESLRYYIFKQEKIKKIETSIHNIIPDYERNSNYTNITKTVSNNISEGIFKNNSATNSTDTPPENNDPGYNDQYILTLIGIIIGFLGFLITLIKEKDPIIIFLKKFRRNDSALEGENQTDKNQPSLKKTNKSESIIEDIKK